MGPTGTIGTVVFVASVAAVGHRVAAEIQTDARAVVTLKLVRATVAARRRLRGRRRNGRSSDPTRRRRHDQSYIAGTATTTAKHTPQNPKTKTNIKKFFSNERHRLAAAAIVVMGSREIR